MTAQTLSGTGGRAVALWGSVSRLLGFVGQRPWLALPLLAAPALWPLYTVGLPRGVDTLSHLLRLGVLDYHLRHGTLYPRWVPELMLGHGYPVFNFYGPLFYYLAEAFHLAGLDYYLSLATTYGVLVLAAGAGMYLLARDVFGRDRAGAALVSATAYMYAPYFLLDIFVRGGLPEATAQAVLPWVFWSYRRIMRDPEPAVYVLPAALSLAALALSHTIMLLFVPPALVAYLVILWLRDRHRRSVGLACLALVGALAASAFFWLPLLGEQRYLARDAYAIARVFLPENVWTWRNFLDAGFRFTYNNDTPFRLGIVQVALAVAGSLMARRRDSEWAYFIVLALVSALAIGVWALPFWMSNTLLQAVQFPWRLLGVMALPLALLTGGICLTLPDPAYRRSAAGIVVGLLIVAQTPAHLADANFFWRGNMDLNAAVTAQLEMEGRILGTSGTQEFRPRWVQDATTYSTASGPAAAAPLELQVEAANAYDLRGRVDSQAGGPLRFSSYYFPGWHVLLDGKSNLTTYPSTNLGLLTVDVPPGSHALDVRWAGTPLQHVAGVVTLLALAGLAVFAWRRRPYRAWVFVPLALLGVGLAGVLIQRPLSAQKQPLERVTAGSAQMLAYRVEQEANGALDVYPLWQATGTVPASFTSRWRLVDAAGEVAAETTGRPWFNTTSAGNWPPGTVVRDGYRLVPRPGVPADAYSLLVALDTPEAQGPFKQVGTVMLAQPAATALQPRASLDVRLGDSTRLVGYDLARQGEQLDTRDGRAVFAHAGESLAYLLYWQATNPLPQDYHGFMHLLDVDGRAVSGQDQLPGPSLRPPLLWDRFHLQPDYYLLRIPAGTPSGLYWPLAGLYDFKTRERLPVYDASDQELPDGVRLPPLKVLGPAPRKPSHTGAEARLGDLAWLAGYDLEAPDGKVRAGTAFTLTLYYGAERASTTGLTRFVHVSSPAAGLVAGADAVPARGANPTWAWVPGELVVDRVSVTIPTGTPPGRYNVSMGLYDAAGGGARLAVTDGRGHLVANAEAPVTTIQVVEAGS